MLVNSTKCSEQTRGTLKRNRSRMNALASCGRAGAPGSTATPPPIPLKPNGATYSNRTLVEVLTQSELYRDYAESFSEATGLPISLRPAESWQLPLHGTCNESAFCEILSHKSKACSVCLSVQAHLTEQATDEAASVVCPAGLCDTVVPVKVGDQLVGYLHTGQVFNKPPTEAQFKRVKKLVREWGVCEDEAALREAYFSTKVVQAKKYESVIRLMSIFAKHLSLLSNTLVLQQQNSEPPVIRRAKEYIQKHQSDDVSLADVARAVNTSTFYFCKMFKRHTGLSFTDYLSRTRVEESKDQLMNPNLRVSEIAFAVGFRSLTHFNRVFKRIVGLSPTEYRAQLPRKGRG